MKMTSTEEVKDIHKGKAALVLGSGPSLNAFKFDEIKIPHVIFACNQSITLLRKCDYFCMTDEETPASNFFDFGIEISDKVVFLGGKHFFKHQHIINRQDKLSDKQLFFDRRWNDPKNICFNTEDGTLIYGTDVIHVTAHLAHVMGCSPIVLVGVDLQYDQGKKYCDATTFDKEVIWPNLERAKPCSDPQGANDPSLYESFHIWRHISYTNQNITFLNANPNGKLSQLFNEFKP